MAEKDAYYYYAQAKNARENGNERLAQIMENYARQIDPVAQERAARAGFADPAEEPRGWNPASNPNAPTREELQNLYNQRMAAAQYTEPPPAPPSPPTVTRNELEMQANLDPPVDFSGRAAQSIPSSLEADPDYREGSYIVPDGGRGSRWETQASPVEVAGRIGNGIAGVNNSIKERSVMHQRERGIDPNRGQWFRDGLGAIGGVLGNINDAITGYSARREKNRRGE